MKVGSRKIGPNEKCPCGSGRKYKKCCRDKTHKVEPSILFQRIQAKEYQRQHQQGFGRPIISQELNGHRFVAVGPTLFCSKKWKTFHDFLLHYIKTVLGSEWGNEELKKPAAECHPLMNWYHDVTVYINERIKIPGEIATATMTGMAAAYLGLAYNLYLLAHNSKIHETLVRRLKSHNAFYGAYHEAFVIGALVRAGFDIELEDESDTTTSHCELTAIFRKTGAKFSVEAKTRGPNKRSVDVGNQLYDALKKCAKHPRIVFIDVNAEGDGKRETQMKILDGVLASIRSREPKLTIDGQPAPSAYVIVTNNPHGTVDCDHVVSAMAEGFKIPDFKVGSVCLPLSEALSMRERHAPILELMKSLAEHLSIPSTFDGEPPQIAFGKTKRRILIGQRYSINTEYGETEGELTDAHVAAKEKQAIGFLRLDNGCYIVGSFSLSDAEMETYYASPQTFFGVLQQKSKLDNPLEIYDWVYEAYRHNSKEHLLKLLSGAPDMATLSSLEQPELAKILAERYTQMIMAESQSASHLRISASSAPLC